MHAFRTRQCFAHRPTGYRAASLTIAGGVLLAALLGAQPASAHVGVELNGGTPTGGKSSTIYLRPGHGCDGDATNAFTVTMPNGVTSFKGQSKPGWTLTRTGNTLTWSGGRLPDDQWDTFGIRLTWPQLSEGATSQVFAFTSVQTCDAELTVNRTADKASVTGRLAEYAGRKVSLKVDGIPLTVRDHVIAPDGSFTIDTTAAKVPATSEVTAWIDGQMVANSLARSEAWTETTPGSAMPAPTVTVVKG